MWVISCSHGWPGLEFYSENFGARHCECRVSSQEAEPWARSQGGLRGVSFDLEKQWRAAVRGARPQEGCLVPLGRRCSSSVQGGCNDSPPMGLPGLKRANGVKAAGAVPVCVTEEVCKTHCHHCHHPIVLILPLNWCGILPKPPNSPRPWFPPLNLKSIVLDTPSERCLGNLETLSVYASVFICGGMNDRHLNHHCISPQKNNSFW